ncbi:Concanavalin A-like lectin/glucanase protein [Marine Group I thaumarchaeote SCGC AAA799-B03]|uniref:Concanavalin A-like lectin/glucanase protein n=1 Tax=Marine Group I thaumarchaeote SCGC AAA799-B03 TaxID=1502289 RepID=A0A087S7K9_9ARCH|nr:Concanavalin A-like lectin/glucanase protein [Marine Group I thaumarchaeote SCGC AAA799-B03]
MIHEKVHSEKHYWRLFVYDENEVEAFKIELEFLDKFIDIYLKECKTLIENNADVQEIKDCLRTVKWLVDQKIKAIGDYHKGKYGDPINKSDLHDISDALHEFFQCLILDNCDKTFDEILDEIIKKHKKFWEYEKNEFEKMMMDIKLKTQNMQIIPSWIKTTTNFWAENQISDDEFVNAMKFLIQENIIRGYAVSEKSMIPENNSNIPKWIKNNAAWWVNDQIDDASFLSGIDYMLDTKIIDIPNIVKLENKKKGEIEIDVVDPPEDGGFDETPTNIKSPPEGGFPMLLYKDWLKGFGQCDRQYEEKWSGEGENRKLKEFTEKCVDKNGNVIGTTTWVYDDEGNLVHVFETPDPSTGKGRNAVIIWYDEDGVAAISCWADGKEEIYREVIKDQNGNYDVLQEEKSFSYVIPDGANWTIKIETENNESHEFSIDPILAVEQNIPQHTESDLYIPPVHLFQSWTPDGWEGALEEGLTTPVPPGGKGDVIPGEDNFVHKEEKTCQDVQNGNIHRFEKGKIDYTLICKDGKQVGKIQYHFDFNGRLINIQFIGESGLISETEIIYLLGHGDAINWIQCKDENGNIIDKKQVKTDDDGNIVLVPFDDSTDSQTDTSDIVIPTPISYWDGTTYQISSYDAGPTETYLVDLFGGNDGKVIGTASVIDSELGKALDFDGTSYVLIENNDNLNFGVDDFTIMAWVKTNTQGTGGANDFILSKSHSGADIQYTLGYRENTNANPWVAMQDPETGELGWAQAQINIADGEFHHIAGVRSGTTMTFYYDGVPKSEIETSYAISATSENPVTVGGRVNQSHDPNFNGQITMIGIFNVALNSDTIKHIYESRELGIGVSGQDSFK